MNFIVGDKAIYTKYSRRSGNKNYLVEILKITPATLHDGTVAGVEHSTVECRTICNADTGKKRRSKLVLTLGRLESLETFIDEKEALLKELGQYL